MALALMSINLIQKLKHLRCFGRQVGINNVHMFEGVCIAINLLIGRIYHSVVGNEAICCESKNFWYDNFHFVFCGAGGRFWMGYCISGIGTSVAE